MAKPIRNILFDVGNVLIHCDFAYAAEEMAKQSHKTAEEIMASLLDHPIIDDFDAGKFPAEEFVSGMQRLSGWKGTSYDLERIWNTMLSPDEAMFDYMESLIERGYKAYILSNVNPYHVKFVKASFPRVLGTHGQVWSCECKLIKPSDEIFHHTKSSFGIDPEDTVFIDDREINIEAARRAGFIGIVHRSLSETEALLEALLNDELT